MAMLSRHFRPLLTSGACYIARSEALLEIMSRHTFWWPGEDVETGRIAFARKMRIRHLDMTVYTEAPPTWRALFRQRRIWWAGNFRHSIVNLDNNALHMPLWSFYYLILVWSGTYLKWHTLFVFPNWRVGLLAMGFVWGFYVILTVVANLQVRSMWMLIFPPYALFQALMMPIVGSIYYLMLAGRIGNAGRYRFGYRRQAAYPERAQGHRDELKAMLSSLHRKPQLVPATAKPRRAYTITVPLEDWLSNAQRQALEEHKRHLLFLADSDSARSLTAALQLARKGFKVYRASGSPAARLRAALASGMIRSEIVLPLAASELPSALVGQAVTTAFADGGDLYRLRRRALSPRGLAGRLCAQELRMQSLSPR
ncbi:MAG: glycosyltransferase, partial [Ktedonobacterales bacterium]